MRWPEIVQGCQAFSALAWLAVAHHYFPAALRTVTGRSRNGWDGAGSWAYALGVVQTSFSIRWLLLGNFDVHQMSTFSLIIWCPLYLLNAGVALGILHTWRDSNYRAALARARSGFALWCAVGAACVGATLWVA